MAMWRSAVAMTAAMLAAGCTTVVAGTVRPGPGLVPTPLSGAAVRQVLLDDAELSKTLDQHFESDADLPPRFGGVDELPDGWASSTPGDCVGALVGAQKTVYQPLPVRDVAHEFWGGSDTEQTQVTGVAEAVIALPTVADAEAAFEKFAEQWSRCRGTTVTRDEDPAANVTAASGTISEVSTGESLLTATVRTSLAGSPGLVVTRALGVQVNCLLDVDIFSSPDEADASGKASGDSGASDVVRAMMDKVRQLAS